MKQPELLTEWRTPYYGQASTVTGDIWWHTDQDGKRTPLVPSAPSAERTAPNTPANDQAQ